MILHTQPRKAWNEYDFVLLEAYQILQDELCPQCHMPRYLCGSTDGDLHFTVRADECDAMIAVRREETRRGKDKDYDPSGVALVPVPVSESGKDLSEFREPYYREQLALRKATTES